MGSQAQALPSTRSGFAYHQILQGQHLVRIPQDLDFTLVRQFGGRKDAQLLLLLLNDLQALWGWSGPSSAGLRGSLAPKNPSAHCPASRLLSCGPFHASLFPPHTLAFVMPLTRKALHPALPLHVPLTTPQHKPCSSRMDALNFACTGIVSAAPEGTPPSVLGGAQALECQLGRYRRDPQGSGLGQVLYCSKPRFPSSPGIKLRAWY